MGIKSTQAWSTITRGPTRLLASTFRHVSPDSPSHLSVILSFTHTSCLPLPVLLPSSGVSGRDKGWSKKGCGDTLWQGALSPLGDAKRSASCFFPQLAKKTQPGSWSSQKECTVLCLLFFSFLFIYHEVNLSPFGRIGEAGIAPKPLA